MELSVAQIKKITVKGDKIPYNFIVNCISSKKTLELLFKDKTYFIPGAISPDDIYVLNDMFNAECISDDDLSHLYEWSGDTEIKQQTAILAYKEVHDDYIAKYLKRSSGNILKSMLNSTRRSADDEAIEFLKLGLTTETALKSALKIAQAKNKAEVASYLLNELDKNKRSISFKL